MIDNLSPSPKSIEWIKKLYAAVRFIQKAREKELDEINKAVQLPPRELARCYVKPDCQQTIPVDAYFARAESGLAQQAERPKKRPILTKLDDFFRDPVPPGILGRNQMIVLADAGMGKTALLTWLKLRSIALREYFRLGRKRFVLMALGAKTLDQIEQIETKHNTVLLLDSLDEDPLAYGRVKDRLIEILGATKAFHRVVLTCRTQFFPETVESRGRVRIGGFECQATYLSFFDDHQVEAYLEKRFPAGFWLRVEKRRTQKALREEARRVIDKMGSLRCRPLLLAYIRELMPSAPDEEPLTERTYSSEYAIYEALVENWLSHQEAKQHPEHKVAGFAEKLFRACELLATELTQKQQRDISEGSLDLLVAQMPDIESIKAMDVKGRSLLNLNANGDYRFAHSSIREFLVAHRILSEAAWTPAARIPCTSLLLDFLLQGRADLPGHKLRLEVVDLKGVQFASKDLTNVDLAECDLAGADFSNANLAGANLERADLSRANLSHADLTNANLQGANLSQADLTGTQVFGADFRGATLKKDHAGELLEEFETITINPDARETVRRTLWAWHFVEELAPGVPLEMVEIPGGTFTMGSPKEEQSSTDDERPQHEVTISPFCMGKFTVTQAQWRVVAGWPKVNQDLNADPSHFEGNDRPVEQVSWEDAAEFCARLSKKTGNAYRLPTEAEWEYACRAGTQTPFAFGETITPEFVNYNYEYPYGNAPKGEYRSATVAVGSLGIANGFGLYDVHGNVWEWCQGREGPYESEPATDPQGPSRGKYRRLRGGSWLSLGNYCRSACRLYYQPGHRYDFFGFRVVVVSRTR